MTTGESDGRPQGLSVAVVTPYFKESPATLQRCLASVSAQTYPRVIHYMVADGFPQTALLAQWPGVRHVQLPNAHANFGCTPRGIGAQCALADGVDVVCFLDADNLLEPEHVATVVQTVAQAQAAGVALDAPPVSARTRAFAACRAARRGRGWVRRHQLHQPDALGGLPVGRLVSDTAVVDADLRSGDVLAHAASPAQGGLDWSAHGAVRIQLGACLRAGRPAAAGNRNARPHLASRWAGLDAR